MTSFQKYTSMTLYKLYNLRNGMLKISLVCSAAANGRWLLIQHRIVTTGYLTSTNSLFTAHHDFSTFSTAMLEIVRHAGSEM